MPLQKGEFSFYPCCRDQNVEESGMHHPGKLESSNCVGSRRSGGGAGGGYVRWSCCGKGIRSWQLYEGCTPIKLHNTREHKLARGEKKKRKREDMAEIANEGKAAKDAKDAKAPAPAKKSRAAAAAKPAKSVATAPAAAKASPAGDFIVAKRFNEVK